MDEQLLHSVLLSEAQQGEYTSLELANIRLQSENVLINYFLDRETRKILDNLKVEDDVLKKIFEDNKKNFKIEPKFKIDTIFMKDGDKAGEILEKVTVENFDKLKEENDVREDKTFKDEFIPLSSIIPPLAAVVAKTDKKGIVKSLVFVGDGCHIINIKDKEEAREPDFEEAKEFVKNEFKKSIYNDMYNKVVEEILNKKHGGNVEKASSEEKVEEKKSE